MLKRLPTLATEASLELHYPPCLDNQHDFQTIHGLVEPLRPLADQIMEMLHGKFSDYPHFRCTQHVVLDGYGLGKSPGIMVRTNVFTAHMPVGAYIDTSTVKAWWGYGPKNNWQEHVTRMTAHHIAALSAAMEPAPGMMPWRIVAMHDGENRRPPANMFYAARIPTPSS